MYADERTFVRVYSSADLADWPGPQPSSGVVDLVFGFVAPHMWEGVGGPCILRDVPGGFVAQQTEEGHAEIASLLARLRMLNDPLLETFADPAAAAERRIEALLDQTVDVDWQERTLREGLKELLAQHGIQPIAFDGAAIDEAGARVDDPCTLALSGVPLRQVLRRALDEKGLSWIIEDGLLVITSDDLADNALTHRLYRLPGTLQAHMPGSADAVIDTLQEIVQTYSWDEMGGPGSIEAVPGGIAVQQTPYAHKELAAALASIGRLGNEYLPDEPLGGRIAADVDLEERLTAPIDFAAVGEPLEAALRRLLRQAGLEDRLHLGPDWPDDSQFSFPFEPVIFRVREVSVAAALRLLLVPHDATFIVRQGMIVPQSREAAENQLFHWFYHLPDRRAENALSNSDVAALLCRVQSYSWDEFGGNGSIRFLPGGFVVQQTAEIQAEIQRLLAQLRPLLADSAAPLPVRPQTAAERRVEAALASPLTCRIAEAPLDLVLETLALRAGIDLFVDPDHGVTLRRLAEPLVGLSAEEEPFARLADRLLSPRALGWTVRHDVLYVADAAAIGREHRLYDARHLLRPRGELTDQELLSLVDGAMHADSSEASSLHGGLLLAAHTRRWHAELHVLLAPGNEVLPRIHALQQAADGGQSAPIDEDCLVALRAALDDPSPAVRRFALRSLLVRAPEVAADSPELLRSLADDDPLVRLAGVLALGKSPPQPEALAPLMALLDDRDVEVRLEAIAELGRMGTNARAAAPRLARLLNDRDPIQRQALLESLTALGEAAQEAGLQLGPLVAEPNFTVAAIAAWESMGAAAVPEILSLLETRRDCFYPCCDALARLGPAASAAAPRLAALLPAFEGFRRERLCQVLGALGAEAAPAVPALVGYLNDDRLSIRTAACRALRDIAADPETAVPALRQALAFALNEPESARMRIAACQALAAFGPQAAAAEPELRRAQSDDHPGVQAAARAALSNLGREP